MTAEKAPRIERPTSGEQTTGMSTARPSPATMMRHTRASDSRKRPVVAVDVDEVLGRFVLQLCAFHNGTYGTSLMPEDFKCYNFHEVWGGTREEADSKMRMFFTSSYFLEGSSGHGIPIIEGAAEVLRKNSQRFELHVVTSRQHVIEEHTKAWIDLYYPGIFDNVHFGNHFSDHGEVRSKSDLCRSIDAVAIIDDNLNYARECAAAGFRTFLFGDYAWNRTSEPLSENIRRTVNWAEVEEALDLIANEKQPLEQGFPMAAAVASADFRGDVKDPSKRNGGQRLLQRGVRKEAGAGGGGGTGAEEELAPEAVPACDLEHLVGKRSSCCLENSTNVNTTNGEGGDGVKAVTHPPAPPVLPKNLVADRHHHEGASGATRSATRDRTGSQSAIVVEGVLSCA